MEICPLAFPGPLAGSRPLSLRRSPGTTRSRHAYPPQLKEAALVTFAVSRRRKWQDRQRCSKLPLRAEGTALVTTVSGYAVRPVVATLPELGDVTAYVVDEDAGVVDEDLPDWVPAEWLNPVMGDSEVSDVYGAIGVWPAAFVAAEAVINYARSTPWSCLELGCGAGFPSLVAARCGAQPVYALDTEQLTLDLLRAAFDQQGQGQFVPLLGNAEDLPEEPLSSVPLIVVSDLLYSVQLGKALGESLAKWLQRQKDRQLILTDGGRSGRGAFLEAFSEAYGSQAYFEDVPVPPWAPETGDFFDGSQTATVGLLRY